ncbi:MAG: ribonuclease D [Nitrospirales bacterium]|nr:ribonuclease D [Nitrospirales bacterium]
MTASPTYITDRQSLRSFVDRLRDQKRIALDTEFVGEDSFVPRLELIQVAAGDLSAAIDFPAVGSLDDFGSLLTDPTIEKVVHAGRQDLELFYAHTGHVPTPIFDTQVAAAMVGYGPQIAYAQLVQRVVGVKLTKAHTFTNWSQRPLTKEQLAYALDDVHYLLSVHTHLQERLEALGRTAWVEEEFVRLGSKLTDGSREPRHRYQRIRGWENLKPRCAAVLRELVAWREEEAKRRDVPRGRVIRDEVLLEMARHIPMKLTALKGMRGLHGSEVERNGEALIKVIERGLAVPESEWPETPKSKRPEPEAAGQVDLLQAVLKAIALKEEIAPTLLAGASDLQELVDAKHDRDKLDLPILHGWRRKLAGETLLDVLQGKLHVSIDQRTGTLTLTSH